MATINLSDILPGGPFESASWDFTQFDATKPSVTLASLMA